MRRLASLAILALAMTADGCASVTTKITGTSRSGSEELLLTGVADRVIASLSFGPLAGRRVFLDTSQVSAPDASWIIFSLRREMARQGLLLQSDKKDAQTIVEASVAAYATDEVDCQFSLPLSIPSNPLVPLPVASIGANTSALTRKNRQDAVVKLALFAYDATTRQLVWESNTLMDTGYLDRRYLGTANYYRRSTQPELETYTPRRAW